MTSVKRFIIIIILICSNQMVGQSLNLKIIAENKDHTKIIDSIGYNNTFDNYNAIDLEVKALVNQLTRQGYIDTTIKRIVKQNDTLFNAELFLGHKINTIRVFYKENFNTELLILSYEF